jgi:hypothetical protein
MSSVLRFARAVPTGPIFRPAEGLPVIARLRWAHGEDIDTAAVAVAWTADAVEILWEQADGAGRRLDGARRARPAPWGAGAGQHGRGHHQGPIQASAAMRACVIQTGLRFVPRKQTC